MGTPARARPQRISLGPSARQPSIRENVSGGVSEPRLLGPRRRDSLFVRRERAVVVVLEAHTSRAELVDRGLDVVDGEVRDRMRRRCVRRPRPYERHTSLHQMSMSRMCPGTCHA